MAKRSAIASLGVSLTARTKNFRRKMQGARKDVRGFSLSVTKAAKRIAVFGAALTAATAGGIALLVKQQFSAIDATAKVADKLGIATEKLQGLRLAAELSGVQIRTFDMGLQRFVRRLSEVTIDTGEAKAALKELGIDARQLQALPLEERFKEIAEAMLRVQSQADRVRLAFKLFDSEGVAIVNTLMMGRKGLEDVQRQAEKLGIAFSRIEAAKVEQANNAILMLRRAITGGAGQIAIGLAPIVKAMADEFTNMSIAASDMARATVQSLGAVALVLDKLISMGNTFSGLMDDARATASLAIAGWHGIAAFMGVEGAADRFRGAAAAADEYARKARKHFAAAGSEAIQKWLEGILANIPSVTPIARGGGGAGGMLGGRNFAAVGQLRSFVPGAGSQRPVPVTSPWLKGINDNTRQMLALWQSGIVGVYGP